MALSTKISSEIVALGRHFLLTVFSPGISPQKLRCANSSPSSSSLSTLGRSTSQCKIPFLLKKSPTSCEKYGASLDEKLIFDFSDEFGLDLMTKAVMFFSGFHFFQAFLISFRPITLPSAIVYL